MANLTVERQYKTRHRGTQAFKVKNGEDIFNGSLVGIQVGGADDGFVVRWTDALTTAARTNQFLGVACVHDDADGKITGDAGATVEVEVDTSGLILEGVDVAGASGNGHTGDLVYASDDNVLTLTATAGKGAIGYVARWRTGDDCDVQLFTPTEFRTVTHFI